MRAKPLHTDEAVELLGRKCGQTHQCIREHRQTHSQTHKVAPPGEAPEEKEFRLNSYELCDGKVYRQVLEHILFTDQQSMFLCLALADEEGNLIPESHWTDEALRRILEATGHSLDVLPRSVTS